MNLKKQKQTKTKTRTQQQTSQMFKLSFKCECFLCLFFDFPSHHTDNDVLFREKHDGKTV